MGSMAGKLCETAQANGISAIMIKGTHKNGKRRRDSSVKSRLTVHRVCLVCACNRLPAQAFSACRLTFRVLD